MRTIVAAPDTEVGWPTAPTPAAGQDRVELAIHTDVGWPTSPVGDAARAATRPEAHYR